MALVDDALKSPRASAPRAVDKVGRFLTIAMYGVGGATLLVMMVYIVVNALMRTVFHTPLPNALELVQYIAMPIVTTLGFVAASIANRHVTADILYDKFPVAGRKWLVFGNIVLTGITFFVLMAYTWIEAMTALERDTKAGYTSISIWPIYFLVPLSFLACGVIFARDAWRTARKPVEEFDVDITEIDVEQALKHETFA